MKNKKGIYLPRWLVFTCLLILVVSAVIIFKDSFYKEIKLILHTASNHSGINKKYLQRFKKTFLISRDGCNVLLRNSQGDTIYNDLEIYFNDYKKEVGIENDNDELNSLRNHVTYLRTSLEKKMGKCSINVKRDFRIFISHNIKDYLMTDYTINIKRDLLSIRNHDSDFYENEIKPLEDLIKKDINDSTDIEIIKRELEILLSKKVSKHKENGGFPKWFYNTVQTFGNIFIYLCLLFLSRLLKLLIFKLLRKKKYKWKWTREFPFLMLDDDVLQPENRTPE